MKKTYITPEAKAFKLQNLMTTLPVSGTKADGEARSKEYKFGEVLWDVETPEEEEQQTTLF